MSSFSSSELSRPHIGSGGGGGVFFAGMPDSQWPAALSTQQAIAFALSEEALEIGTSIAKNDRATKKHKKHNMPFENRLCILCFIAASLVIRLGCHRLADKFHLALSANAA
jgi:hypothetical protein